MSIEVDTAIRELEALAKHDREQYEARRSFGFAKAMEFMLAGESVRGKNWSSRAYCTLDERSKAVVLHPNGPFMVYPSMFADDYWECVD